jgi:hypothetical protein
MILVPWQWLPLLASLVLHLRHLSAIVDPREDTLDTCSCILCSSPCISSLSLSCSISCDTQQ